MSNALAQFASVKGTPEATTHNSGMSTSDTPLSETKACEASVSETRGSKTPVIDVRACETHQAGYLLARYLHVRQLT